MNVGILHHHFPSTALRQALTDRASRGLSLVPGFKSKQEKSTVKVSVP